MPDIAKLLWPKTVAVVGASSDLHGLRGRILEVMLSHPYAGTIYPVSRSATEVQGRKAYRSVAELPGPADLAVLIIPAEFVVEELERCGRAGVKAAVILSSGFAEEPGEAGTRMQEALRATAARYDMAVCGPNSEGFANIAAALCPTFSPAMDVSAGPLLPKRPLGGQVSVISQSGGLGFAFFDRARGRNLAFRHIVTTGNEAVLETSDFLDAMLDEGKTDVYLLLLEDVKTPAKFRRAADKALKAGKPLIVAKIGQTEPGRRAVASHTAALAGSHAAYRAIFERYGVIEGRDFDEMIDLAAGFLACGDKLPAGKRMGICTSSGGAGVWMADACVRAGLDVPGARCANARGDRRASAVLRHLAEPGRFDRAGRAQARLRRIRAAGGAIAADRRRHGGGDGAPLGLPGRRSAKADGAGARDHKAGLHVDLHAALGKKHRGAQRGRLSAVHQCRQLRAHHAGDGGLSRAARAAAANRPDSGTAPDMRAARACWRHHGRAVRVAGAAAARGLWHRRRRRDSGALGRRCRSGGTRGRFRGPVALKVQSPDIPHKTEAGGVALNVSGADAVRAAYERVLAAAKRHAPHARIDGVLVQPMAPPGREVILGVNRDPDWGPLLMVGLGGVLVEALGDVALAPVPLDHAGARALLGRLKGAAVLGAFRGAPPADTDALVELMVRLSQFAADHADDIAEIDLNPVIVHAKGQGVSLVDALIVKQQPRPAQHRAAE